jgi:hypothetical protein
VDHLERYLLVRSGKVVGLERYPWYGVGWKVFRLLKVISNQLRTGSREYIPQDNRCRHLFGMEQLAY